MGLRLKYLLLAACLLPAAVPSEASGRMAGKASKPAASASDELPAVNWRLLSAGFIEMFKLRNREIESSKPGRFFPGIVAFALGRFDENGHYLMLNCGSADTCLAKRDALEDRMVHATLLDAVRTPNARKDQLYDARTWELTPLGERYLEILKKRHPDLYQRLGKLIAAALAQQ